MQDIIDAVKAYALANYETGGWDFVVECWSDEEIAAEIVGLGEKAAIKRIGRIVGLIDEQRQDARSAGGEY